MLSDPPGSSLSLQKQGFSPEEDPYSKHPYRLRGPCGLPQQFFLLPSYPVSYPYLGT